MPVTSLSSSVALLGPIKCKRPRLAQLLSFWEQALCLLKDPTAQQSLLDRRKAVMYGTMERLQRFDGGPPHVFSINALLAISSFEFVCHLAETISSQDRMLGPVQMRNAPAAVGCFVINALAWALLAYRSHYEANEGRALAAFGAGCAAQTAARCVLSIAPIYAPWCRLSGAVFGLLGAKMVHDTRHQRLSVFHQSKLQMTTYNAATGETVTGLYGPISEELSYVDCASHIVCAAAACVMPTHVWCNAAALCGGALTAYLLGPHWIPGKLLAPEGESFRIGFRRAQPFYDYIEDRPPLPWLAFPPDPVLSDLTSSKPPEAILSILDLDTFADCVGKTD